jgi:hypothetical protein
MSHASYQLLQPASKSLCVFPLSSRSNGICMGQPFQSLTLWLAWIRLLASRKACDCIQRPIQKPSPSLPSGPHWQVFRWLAKSLQLGHRFRGSYAFVLLARPLLTPFRFLCWLVRSSQRNSLATGLGPWQAQPKLFSLLPGQFTEADASLQASVLSPKQPSNTRRFNSLVGLLGALF